MSVVNHTHFESIDIFLESFYQLKFNDESNETLVNTYYEEYGSNNFIYDEDNKYSRVLIFSIGTAGATVDRISTLIPDFINTNFSLLHEEFFIISIDPQYKDIKYINKFISLLKGIKKNNYHESVPYIHLFTISDKLPSYDESTEEKLSLLQSFVNLQKIGSTFKYYKSSCTLNNPIYDKLKAFFKSFLDMKFKLIIENSAWYSTSTDSFVPERIVDEIKKYDWESKLIQLGINFERLCTIPKMLDELNHDDLIFRLMPYVKDPVPFFSRSAVSHDLIVTPRLLSYVNSLKSEKSVAAGAGAAGGSRRRRGKKLRRTLRRKGRVWMR